jgi:hypothetical protein
MRKALFTLALLASASTLSLTAHADTIDDFTLVGQGHIITYSLPSSAIIVEHPHAITLTASALTTIDGVPSVETGTYYLPGPGLFPSIILSVPSSIDGGNLLLYGPYPLQVSEVIPMGLGQPNNLLVAFVPGTYNFALGNLGIGFPPPTYTLTITTESAETPEPASLTLLATGALGIISIAARRRRARHLFN